MANLVTTMEGQSFDELIGDTSVKIVIHNVTIAAGQGTLNRGTVLGKITETQKFVICDKTKTDGSQLADCVLAQTVNTESDIVAAAYVAGSFNREKLIIAAGDNALDHADELRDKNIYLNKLEG